jgi:hypothetical protein
MPHSENLSKIYFLSNKNNFELSHLSLSSKIVFRIMYISLAITNLIGNSLLMLVIIKNKKMHKVTNFFVLNLAFADILTSLFSTPFQVFSLYTFFFVKISN